MDLQVSYYKSCVLSIHRGLSFGTPSNAKPLFLLAIIKGIEEGTIIGNQIRYDDLIERDYYELCKLYEPSRKPAPLFKPFFHSDKENYYSIKWKNGHMPAHNYHTPSSRFIKDNMEYAYLDSGFWDILQDNKSRDEFKTVIKKQYLD